jgi:isocitrate dehydrogenase
MENVNVLNFKEKFGDIVSSFEFFEKTTKKELIKFLKKNFSLKESNYEIEKNVVLWEGKQTAIGDYTIIIK